MWTALIFLTIVGLSVVLVYNIGAMVRDVVDEIYKNRGE